MKNVIIRDTTEKDIDEAARHLLSELQPGDIILSGPIPTKIKAKYINVISIFVRNVFKGITHSCIYMGRGRIIDIDLHLTQREDVEVLSLRQFLRNKIDSFGGVRVYVVTPKNYRKAQRRLAILESNNFNRKKAYLRYTYIGSVLTAWRYIFRRRKIYKEDLSFRNNWTCGEMVAYILKRAGTPIGKKASYTFVPPMFVNKKYFHVKKKVCLGL